MPRAISWRELSIGVIALAVLIGTVLSILLFARVGGLRGETAKLYVLTDRATGVLGGTEVWLWGEKIGLVKTVHFRAASTDTMRRLSIETEVLSDKLQYIRKNSFADIRAGGNLIGSPVVYISSGTAESPVVRAGDTLVTALGGAMKDVGAQMDRVEGRVTSLLDTTRKVLEVLNSPSGTIGAFRRNGLPQLTAVTGTASRLSHAVSNGNGTVGLAMRGDVRGRFSRLLSAKDSIFLLLDSGQGNVGRFRRDSTLPRTVAHIRSEADSLRAMLSNRSSTGGRLRSDSTLMKEVDRVRAELDALMRDIRKRPLRYFSY